MSGGLHIAFRRGGPTIEAGEDPVLGEPRWDPAKSRLGLFNNIGARYEWMLSTVDGYHYLNPNERLGGRTIADADNEVTLDWDVAGELRIKNKLTNTTYARFTESGVYLTNPITGGDTEVGISQRLLNGNLACKILSNPPVMPRSTMSLIANASELIAPNWLLWKFAGSSGDIAVGFDESDVSAPDSPRSFSLNVIGAPNYAGIRSFVHTYDAFRFRTVCVRGSYKGPAGEVCSMRVVSALGEIALRTFVFTGSWQDEHLTFLVPDANGVFLGIDYIYNPCSTNPALLTVKADRFGISVGAIPPRYESRSAEIEAGLLRGIFTEGAAFPLGTASAGISLGTIATPEIRALSSSGTVAVTDVNSLGAVVSVAAGGSGLKRVDYTAAVVIRTAETL